MSNSMVKLKFVSSSTSSSGGGDGKELLVSWPASHVPLDAKYSVEQKDNKKEKTIDNTTAAPVMIHAQSNVPFSSTGVESDVEYFLATRDRHGRLVCHPTNLVRMFPCYDHLDSTDKQTDDTARLSRKEQLDELKEKFGSRKSQRDLASKRKYEIQFGQEDVENLPTIKDGLKQEDNKVVKSEEKPLSSILPPRNTEAKNVEEVYQLEDIINELEEEAIMNYEDQLFGAIKCELMKSMVHSTADSKRRVMAIYADLLLQLVRLNATEMRKNDPLPHLEGNIKHLLFERFLTTKQSTRSMRYVITDQNKDRIYVHLFILLLMINNYKPLELEKLQTYCKLTQSSIRRMLELIGCYIEITRSSSGVAVRVARLKLPLNVFRENNKRFKR